ncbi:hypothetical protein FS749_000689 [Ceratobasidium sp. UAMH 11750]|nr:hypothetical protein FS749_000689 [Ceratobasidium sp. UAMH 11750]
MWLKTSLGEYAMLLPHGCFIKSWDTILKDLGDQFKFSAFQKWPSEGLRLDWWHDQAPDEWQTSSRPSLDLKRGQSEAHEEGVKRLRLSGSPDAGSNQRRSKDKDSQATKSEPETTRHLRCAWSMQDNEQKPKKKKWKMCL